MLVSHSLVALCCCVGVGLQICLCAQVSLVVCMYVRLCCVANVVLL